MPESGSVLTARREVPGGDDTTAVVLMVTSPAGVTSTPSVTSGGGGTVWTAQVALTSGGVWSLRWVVTGAGAGIASEAVSVAPAPSSRRSYATTADLADWLQAAPPVKASTLLARATRFMDNRLLRTAVYPVDGDGMPTTAAHIVALRDACCAQAEWWDANGDDGTGAGTDYTSVTAGSISLSRTAGASGSPPDPRVSREAVEILGGAGLVSHGVGTWR